MRHDADLVQGPLYAYLEHFRQRQFLEAGHNDVDVFVPHPVMEVDAGAGGPYPSSSETNYRQFEKDKLPRPGNNNERFQVVE